MFNRSFDDVLHSCLDRIELGDTVEACLEDFPHHAAELQRHLELAIHLHELPKHKPAFSADLQFKQQLQQAELTQPPRRQWPLKIQFENPFKNLRTALLELSLLTLILIGFFFALKAQSFPAGINATIASQYIKPISRADLENMPYNAALVGSIQLEDGSSPLSSTFYSGAPHQIQLGNKIAFGDLNQDKVDDAAALLYRHDQSAIPLWSLVIVQNDGGTAQNVASKFIGPNLVVESLEIEGGLVHITVVDMAGNSFSKIYKLDQTDLKLVYERVDLNKKNSAKNSQQDALKDAPFDPANSIEDLQLLSDLSFPLEGRRLIFKSGFITGEQYSSRLLDSQTIYTDPDSESFTQSVAVLLTQATSQQSVYFLIVFTDTDALAVPLTTLSEHEDQPSIFATDSPDLAINLKSITITDGDVTVDLTADALNLKTSYRFNLTDTD